MNSSDISEQSDEKPRVLSSLTTVTLTSKYLALVLFILVPLLMLYVGYITGSSVQSVQQMQPEFPIDVKSERSNDATDIVQSQNSADETLYNFISDLQIVRSIQNPYDENSSIDIAVAGGNRFCGDKNSDSPCYFFIKDFPPFSMKDLYSRIHVWIGSGLLDTQSVQFTDEKTINFVQSWRDLDGANVEEIVNMDIRSGVYETVTLKRHKQPYKQDTTVR